MKKITFNELKKMVLTEAVEDSYLINDDNCLDRWPEHPDYDIFSKYFAEVAVKFYPLANWEIGTFGIPNASFDKATEIELQKAFAKVQPGLRDDFEEVFWDEITDCYDDPKGWMNTEPFCWVK